jgi:two-component system, OmpR family, sensor histidine kinase ChvG
LNLKRQLLLVSLLTLVLPWAGCQFVGETESVLRNGQQQMLAGTALAIADSLSQFPNEFLTSGTDRFSEDQVYGHPLTNPPLIDGYFDDWSIDSNSLRSMRGTDGEIRFVFGTYGHNVFLYVDVRDANVTYAAPQRSIADVDHVTLVTTGNKRGSGHFLFSAEAPGAIPAVRVENGNTVVDSQLAASWQDTATGYRLEVRIPRYKLGQQLGVEVHNASAGAPVISRTFSRDQPGRFVTMSALLNSYVAAYAQPGFRLTITDRAGWRLAQAGGLSGSNVDNRFSVVPAGWQLIAYRALLEQGKASALAAPDPSGRERQSYVARALNNEATSSWFRNAETGRAVVTVAQPVWSGNVQTGALILQKDTADILSLTNESLLRLITLTIVATVGAALGLLGYASWLSLRIRRLSHAADHALDNEIPLTDMPSTNATDEIGDLSRSFSSVMQQLAAYNEYLRSLASKLSHELRTPLTIVKSSLENLDHEPLTDQSRQYTERARTGVERLQRILNAMSEANRVEQLMENVESEAFSLPGVIEATTSAYRDAWPARRFTFTADASDGDILGSPELIVQMLDKLVDNAVDFSSTGDEISIGLTRTDDELTLSVSNPGPPLPNSMQNRLFESMVSVRADAAGENLGLGLNIAKIIAEGHGGSIRGENTDDGVRFLVVLPVYSG